jgi:hypothetical protein
MDDLQINTPTPEGEKTQQPLPPTFAQVAGPVTPPTGMLPPLGAQPPATPITDITDSTPAKSLYETMPSAEEPAPESQLQPSAPQKRGINKFALIGGIAALVIVVGAGIYFGKGLIFKEQTAPAEITRFVAEETCPADQYAPENAVENVGEQTGATSESQAVSHAPCETISHDNLIAGNSQCSLIDTINENPGRYLVADETTTNLQQWYGACHIEPIPANIGATQETSAVTEQTEMTTEQTETSTEETLISTQETSQETAPTAALPQETQTSTQQTQTENQSSHPAALEIQPVAPAIQADAPAIQSATQQTAQFDTIASSSPARDSNACSGPYQSAASAGQCNFNCQTFLDDLLKAESDPAYVATSAGKSLTQRSLEDLLLQHEECAQESPTTAQTQQTQMQPAAQNTQTPSQLPPLPLSTTQTSGSTSGASQQLTVVPVTGSTQTQETAARPAAPELSQAAQTTQKPTDITKELYPTGPEVYIYLIGVILTQAFIFRKKIYAFATSL